MSFHSTTLLPGESPFVKTEHDFEVFLKRIEKFLEFAASNDIQFASLNEAMENNI